jgi:hypothetical protein
MKLEKLKDAFKADPEKALAAYRYKKPPMELTPELRDAKIEAGKLKNKVRQMIKKQELAERGWGQRTADGFLKFRRFVLLSSLGTIEKLSSAALARIAVTPVEEIIGSGVRLLPVMRRVAAEAPREGGGFSLSAELSALSHTFSRETAQDMWDKAALPLLYHGDQAGKNHLDLLHGGNDKYADMPPALIEMFGRIHGALKTPAEINEYYRSYAQLMKWHSEHGYNVSDPAVEAAIGAASFIHANRAIFMSDSGMQNAWKVVLYALENSKHDGLKGAAYTLRMLIPLTKVPTNIAAELQQMTTGGVNVLYKLAKQKIKKGGKLGEGFTPEEADYIMRAAKKQTLGALMMYALAPYALAAVGGLYSQADKRKPGDLKPGDLEINGVKIPQKLQHNIPMMAAQVYGTYRRVKEQYRVSGKPYGTAAAIGSAGFAMAEELPFIGGVVKILESLKTPDGRAKFVEELAASLVIPPDLGNVAKMRDHAPGTPMIDRMFGPDTPRKPEEPGDVFKSKIPGLREQVPLNERAFKSEIVGQLRKGEDLTDDQQAALEQMSDKQMANINKEVGSKAGLQQFKYSASPEERKEYHSVFREKITKLDPTAPAAFKKALKAAADAPDEVKREILPVLQRKADRTVDAEDQQEYYRLLKAARE